MSAHTPGPWAYSEQFDGDGESLGLEVVANRAAVTRLPGVGLEDYANAQLIAAAPRLLAALEGLHWACSGIAYIQEEYAEQVEAARAAIVAATGDAA
jgi:hypothetical protein